MNKFIDAPWGKGILSPARASGPALGQVPMPRSPHDDYVGERGPAARADSGGEVSIQAITASFSPASGVLSVFGDALDNTQSVGRDAAGTILVNGGAVAVTGGTPTVANTSLIQVFGLGGNDAITLDQTMGALPRGNLFGGAGNDTVTGGSGGDMLFGQSGNDQLSGGGGFDFLFGGSENDTLTGGDGDDQMFGESGDDLMIWNPGDDTDLHEGGTGNDTSQVNGGGGAEVFTATANGTRVRFDRIDPAPFAIDIGTTENLVLDMNGGNDTFSATGNLAALIKVIVNGGAGNDTILGSNGADTLIGGTGNDFVDGQQGNDAVFLGAGDDVFQWDPGDGSDVVEGQGGTDQMQFNGSAGSEIFTASANDGRLLFTRNLGNIVMDLNGVERLELKALGGTDTVVVNDLSGTGAQQVRIDLAGVLGGAAGDGMADTVIAGGTSGQDFVSIFGDATWAAVVGLPAVVQLANADGQDSLVVNALGGNDQITATGLLPGIKLTLDGGAGNDQLRGGQGNDVLLGGDGNDLVFGDNGDDVAFLGAGADLFQWDPGDGSDVVEGQDGTDRLLFNGADVGENITVVANGDRTLFFRDVANVSMDLNDVEHITFKALGGVDNVFVGDLSGTDLTEISLDLGFDGAQDSVTATGTNGDDVISAATFRAQATVSGLPTLIRIGGVDVGLDRLTINGLAGNDTLDASDLQAGRFQLTMNGGLGDDEMIGSRGDDLLNGGDGDDLALMGAGNDTFVWNPGDDNDTLEGQAGVDTMLFNGANVAENISITGSDGRVIFFRDIANVTMNLDGVEAIDFKALGGADTIVVNDLSGTDVSVVNIDLAASGGGGDGQADTVVIDATNGDDAIIVLTEGGVVRVLGLAADVAITGFEAHDRLVINGLDGDDVIEASGLPSMALTGNGGADDDVLIGSQGADVLLGEDGDDALLGGGDIDVIDGGPGDDIEIQGLLLV